MVDRIALFCLQLIRAWRYYRLLDYSWRLAWAKAAAQCGQL